MFVSVPSASEKRPMSTSDRKTHFSLTISGVEHERREMAFTGKGLVAAALVATSSSTPTTTRPKALRNEP